MTKDEVNELVQSCMQNDNLMSKLSDECYKSLIKSKKPENQPIAIIVSGQTGSGKSFLMDYSSNELQNSIHHDFDYFRAFFPFLDLVKSEYPDKVAQITNPFSNKLSKLVAKKLIENKYNIIFQKNLQSDIVIEDTLSILKQQNYLILFRVLAVNLIESKMSIIERAKEDLNNNGWYRLSDIPYQNDSYHSLLSTIESIENKNMYDCMQVFIRGDKFGERKLIYSRDNINSKSIMNVNKDIYIKLEMGQFNCDKFLSTRSAINFGRELSEKSTMKSIKNRIRKIKEELPCFAPDNIKDIEKNVSEFVNNKEKIT